MGLAALDALDLLYALLDGVQLKQIARMRAARRGQRPFTRGTVGGGMDGRDNARDVTVEISSTMRESHS